MRYIIYSIALAVVFISCNNKPEVKPVVAENIQDTWPPEKIKELERLIAKHDTTGQPPMPAGVKAESEVLKREAEKRQ